MRFRSDNGRVLAEGLAWRVLERGDDDYPDGLEHLPDPPERVWIAGRRVTELLPAAAIVGTRTPSAYGQEIAYALAGDLARRGVCVVSGLARGIDSWAHAGALEHGTTVAVLPGGIDVCYPSSNRELYERIAERGALVAEHPPGTPTHKRRFTHRNRIIAALSTCTVVVQAGERSGALTTAGHALSIGRDVLAVPGDVRLDVSAGPHQLLAEGAAPCTCAGDILERVGISGASGSGPRRLQPIPADLARNQAAVLDQLGGETMRISHVGELAELSGPELSTTIVLLELDGWITRCGGGMVRRLR